MMRASHDARAQTPAPPAFAVTVEPDPPRGMVITVSGELDIATAPRLREHLEAAAGARTLVVDLHAVSFIDSVALAVLLQAQRRLGEGGRMAVSLPAASYTRLIFEAAGLDRCLSLFETRSDALAHVGG